MTVATRGPRTSARRQTSAAKNDDKNQGTPSPANLQARQEAAQRERADRITAVTDAIGMVQIPLATFAAVEQRRIGKDEVGSFTLDIVTIDSHKGPLAEAITDLAEHYPVLGAVLDKLAKATPFGALLSVAISLGAQLAENHRALPTHLRGASPNLVPRDEFIAHLKAQIGSEVPVDDRQTVGANGGPQNR